MGHFTAKFGGTSLASAEQIQKAVDIIRADPRRRFVVPSAPGKRHGDDIKITDLLIGWHKTMSSGLNPQEAIDIIKTRFVELAEKLKVDIDMEAEINTIAEAAPEQDSVEYLASRGEHLNAKLIAKLLDAEFVETAECVRFTAEGRLSSETYDLLGERLSGEGIFVIPGYYGADSEGNIRTFSRGGSDVTGSVVARATQSEVYENWTDVSGFRMTDPRIVPEAKRIEEITYRELRELAYMGASVLHDEAIFPLRSIGIPIHIRNTNKPDEAGTMIVKDRVPSQPVCGIAARRGFTMINIEKTLMNREVGFVRRVLSILEEHRVSFEHMPTGIDTISLLLTDESLQRHGESIVLGIDRVCEPDRVSLTPGLALVATVGQGMNHHVGVAARMCNALSEAGVNLRVIDQGSSEMNIIIGVNEDDMETAVRAIYDAFNDWTA